MKWPRNVLTDSGGFQMVSLFELAKFSEFGVLFKDSTNGKELLLTPEKSIQLQTKIRSDIMMALDVKNVLFRLDKFCKLMKLRDKMITLIYNLFKLVFKSFMFKKTKDVVSTINDNFYRFKVSTFRTIRWFGRSIQNDNKPNFQNLFGIVQGGLDKKFRNLCMNQFSKQNESLNGYAIGVLVGGEQKKSFWSIVYQCTCKLPKNKPRYCMGVGFPIDLIICSSLGIDMFDCVYPCRTARFGTVLVSQGILVQVI